MNYLLVVQLIRRTPLGQSTDVVGRAFSVHAECRFFRLPEFIVALAGMITMTMRELDRLKVIEAVIEERLMLWRAAERLGISRRQVERLTSRYRSEGAAGLVSRQRGRSSNRQLPVNLVAQ
ncbi:transcriptional regulator GlxA family with amidase domain [Caballeronia udeis]|uniref:Transcriptional regulator GlxA family with amidase domain n=1 Tax=Caballeronia udeis TaxID=1232866 RepID=A0ABW8MEY9_9BURK